jgi:hypothetical protein
MPFFMTSHLEHRPQHQCHSPRPGQRFHPPKSVPTTKPHRKSNLREKAKLDVGTPQIGHRGVKAGAQVAAHHRTITHLLYEKLRMVEQRRLLFHLQYLLHSVFSRTTMTTSISQDESVLARSTPLLYPRRSLDSVHLLTMTMHFLA